VFQIKLLCCGNLTTTISMVRAVLALLPVCVFANDPAGSWLTYAVWSDPQDRKITALNTTWVVPSNPSTPYGSNAPGWWFGTQTKNGDGALVQPILAYGYEGNFYSIFNGVYDWTDGSWHTSSQSITVQPGDKIVSSVTTSDGGSSYDMTIASQQQGKSITTKYNIEAAIRSRISGILCFGTPASNMPGLPNQWRVHF